MFDLELMVKTRQEDIQREAERRRLARMVVQPRSPLRRTVSSISRSMIKLGAWLERQMGESMASPPVRTAK